VGSLLDSLGLKSFAFLATQVFIFSYNIAIQLEVLAFYEVLAKKSVAQQFMNKIGSRGVFAVDAQFALGIHKGLFIWPAPLCDKAVKAAHLIHQRGRRVECR
jgi:hypothetical protein